MKYFIRMFYVIALVLLGIRCSYAFDIAVYFDARSGVNWRCQNPGQYFCGDVLAPRETVLGRINSEQQVFDWFHEMGVTHMITYYPFSSDLTDLHSRELHGMKILNASHPGEAFTC